MYDYKIVEQISRKKKSMSGVLRKVMVLFAVIFVILGITISQSFMLAGFLLAALYFVFDIFSQKDYEYTLENDQLSIDVIYGKKYRKTAHVLELKDLEVVAPHWHESVAKYKKNGGTEQLKKFDYTSYDDNTPYYTMIIKEDGRKIKLLLDLTEEMLHTIKTQHPENVYFAYDEKEVLKGINLTIPQGKITAFVGPSGSGKSTIAKLIASFWDVTGGLITIGGKSVKEISTDQLNDLISYVSQDNYLFNDTVRNNIRMGKSEASDSEVEQIAKASGCHEFIMNLEHGYETVVGGAGGHLSGGERQRIAIARAMLKNAPIVILDEATSYTDPENEAVIQEAISRLTKGKTLIVIAHRLSTITDADQIVVVKDGTIQAKGTHEELLKECSLYHTMWTAHMGAKEVKTV